jgi:predicted KAP-like P-loop ATPase
METDVPIIDPKDDRFGYQPFASQLAPSLILRAGAPSLIVGVEAGWGTGKTSFLNLTRRALQGAVGEPLVVDYQPWLYSTIDALLLGFCTQLATQLENRNPQKFEKISSALSDFAQALSPLAHLSGHEAAMLLTTGGLRVLARLASALGQRKKIEISNARARVQQAITDYGQPIIIFIDDIDRLAPGEIRFQSEK